MLTLIEKTIATHSSEPEQSVIDEHTNLLARRIASEGIVLVKNENNTLPLALKTAPKIALVGASATNPPIGGGGSASAPPQYLQNPFELIKKLHSQPDAVKLAGGVKVHNTIPLLPASKMKAANGESGINVSYFNNGVDEPVLTEYLQHPQVVMLGRIKDGLKHGDFRYEMSTSLTPETTGLHTVAIQSTGNFSLFVDGIEVC
jgi:beta-glucosidase